MGEYYKGHKIGTCEELLYIRHAELLQLKHEKNNADIGMSVYLQDNFQYRFPWPDEDSAPFPARRDAFRSILFTAPADLDYTHTTRPVSVKVDDLYFKMDVFLPCPASRAFASLNLRTSPTPPHPVKLFMQIMAHGALFSLFHCAYCGAGFYCDDPAELAMIKEAIRGQYITESADQGTKDFYQKIIDRL